MSDHFFKTKQGLKLSREGHWPYPWDNEYPTLPNSNISGNTALLEYYNTPFINYDQVGHNRESPPQLIPNLVVQGDGSSFVRLAADASKGKYERK